MLNIYSFLGLLIACLIALTGLMIGLDEPQNTPTELLSDLLKQGAIALLLLTSIPQIIRFI